MTDSPFIEDTSLQFAWDSVSLGLLKECPRKYYYILVCGWQGKAGSLHLKFGIWFHAALEMYDKRRADDPSLTHDDAVAVVTAWLLNETWERGDVPGPWETHDTKKNRETLIRSVVWYLEHYKDDPAQTVILHNGKPAVELSFKLELPHRDPNGDPYLYCGHLDRLVDFAGDKFVMDRKTSGSTLGAYYFRQYNPDNQMSGYVLAGKTIFNVPVQGVIIDAAQIAVGFTDFQRGMTTRSDGQLEEWVDNTGHWFKVAEMYAERGAWPMNEKSCNNYGGCVFRDTVCSQDPAVRDRFLETYFEKRHWNPLEER